MLVSSRPCVYSSERPRVLLRQQEPLAYLASFSAPPLLVHLARLLCSIRGTRWTTELNSKERNKVNFEILQGPLIGKAVAIVTASGARARSCGPPRPAMLLVVGGRFCSGAHSQQQVSVPWHLCQVSDVSTSTPLRALLSYAPAGSDQCSVKSYPAIASSHVGSQLFVYHADVSVPGRSPAGSGAMPPFAAFALLAAERGQAKQRGGGKGRGRIRS
jgi:hypothetical protein